MSRLEQLHKEALRAAQAFADAASINETEFTGWGDGEVPPAAEMARIKADQAVSALRDALRQRQNAQKDRQS
ncbi:hypothetical protein OOZ54_13235 [Rhodopseudomonas palustris]|uniref:hypothetical protein n=1 Tax=Rhodopseudomonas palustris TaxID=1076 RepID=UPI0022F08C16|nr:hypothetical protein [Rhodopseudomonas palustris]WBU27627.1 hypothetical protein OOZ54_13235 [Rhodopseudomonas palustris]